MAPVALVKINVVAVAFVMVPLSAVKIWVAKVVAVALVNVALVVTRESINALVALRFDVVTPPMKVTGMEVVAPRAVTEARVSVE